MRIKDWIEQSVMKDAQGVVKLCETTLGTPLKLT